MTGIEQITEERYKQMHKNKHTVYSDKLLNNEEQLIVAVEILLQNTPLNKVDMDQNFQCPHKWNQEDFRSMLNKSYKERLIIAGALIAAEIDRIE